MVVDICEILFIGKNDLGKLDAVGRNQIASLSRRMALSGTY